MYHESVGMQNEPGNARWEVQLGIIGQYTNQCTDNVERMNMARCQSYPTVRYFSVPTGC